MQQQLTANFENDGKGLIFIGRGVISGEEMIRKTEKTYSPEILAQLRYQIVDLREVERMDITTEQMQRLAKMDRHAAEQTPGTKIVIVATHDLAIGLGRIYSAYAEGPKLEARTFPTMEEARAWVDADRADPGSRAYTG